MGDSGLSVEVYPYWVAKNQKTLAIGGAEPDRYVGLVVLDCVSNKTGQNPLQPTWVCVHDHCFGAVHLYTKPPARARGNLLHQQAHVHILESDALAPRI
jgi:hypothetical protein